MSARRAALNFARILAERACPDYETTRPAAKERP